MKVNPRDSYSWRNTYFIQEIRKIYIIGKYVLHLSWQVKQEIDLYLSNFIRLDWYFNIAIIALIKNSTSSYKFEIN